MKKLILLIFLIIPFISFGNLEFDNDKDGNKTSGSSTFIIIQNGESDTISLEFNSAEINSVKIIDNNSNIIYEISKPRGSAKILNIPIDDMEPGTYFIRSQTENGISIERIIIQ